MAENNTPAGEPQKDQSGTDPTKTDSGNNQVEQFDPAKLTDEQFDAVFKDQRLWQHERFKKLNERAKLAEKYEGDQKAQEEEKLKKEKKYEELLALKDNELKETRETLSKVRIDNLVQAEATKAGIIDLEAATKLLDRTTIKVGEDGEISGVSEAVKALTESKPYLLNKEKQPSLGTGSKPSGDSSTTQRKFRLSEIQDVKFYRENEKEIMAALQAGLVVDDINQ